MMGTRLFGSLSSGAANLVLYGTLLALWPSPGECAYGLCVVGDRDAEPVFVHIWKPFIDNPGSGWASAPRQPRCSEPQGTSDAHNLIAAPLPATYDPHAYREKRVYACVLVGPDGDVLDARMLRGTGEPKRDLELVRSIRKGWRFKALYLERPGPTWQRVRLNAGAVEGGVSYALPIY